MGRELIDAYPTFKATLREAEGYLTKLGATWSLIGKFSTQDKNHGYLTIYRGTSEG
jgi:hypothetical protein